VLEVAGGDLWLVSLGVQSGEVRQSLDHLTCGAGARRSVMAEQREHEVVQLGRDLGHQGRWRGNAPFPCGRQLVEREGTHRDLTGERPVGERAQRIQVHALVQPFARQAFGRDECRCADHFARHTKRRKGAKVDELRFIPAREPNVVGAHVAVNQPTGMHEGERRCDVA
jgi:hypothetical protein